MKQVLNPSFALYNDNLSPAKGNVVRTRASEVLHKRMASTTENLLVISGIPNAGHLEPSKNTEKRQLQKHRHKMNFQSLGVGY